MEQTTIYFLYIEIKIHFDILRKNLLYTQRYYEKVQNYLFAPIHIQYSMQFPLVVLETENTPQQISLPE